MIFVPLQRPGYAAVAKRCAFLALGLEEHPSVLSSCIGSALEAEQQMIRKSQPVRSTAGALQ
jgi:hypothetical protein